MSYVLNLAADGRILSATFEQYAGKNVILTDTLPEGDITDYRWDDGFFVFSPQTKSEGTVSMLVSQKDTDALLVDHEYRLTLLELDLAES